MVCGSSDKNNFGRMIATEPWIENDGAMKNDNSNSNKRKKKTRNKPNKTVVDNRLLAVNRHDPLNSNP